MTEREPLYCATCGLELPEGVTHKDPSTCVVDLRAALDAYSSCERCGDPLTLCLRCAAKDVALEKGAQIALGLWERLKGTPSPRPRPKRKCP